MLSTFELNRKMPELAQAIESNGEGCSVFSLPFVNDNADGWGPNNQPDKYKDLPYQKFSKSDKIGKVRIFYDNIEF
jgi:hypothetical protein